MAMFIQDNGRTIKPTEKEYIYTKMGPNIQEIGSRILNTDSDARNGLMDPHTKGKYIYNLGIIRMDLKMEKENLHGKMVTAIKEIS